jgi:hypothetical protein
LIPVAAFQGSYPVVFDLFTSAVGVRVIQPSAPGNCRDEPEVGIEKTTNAYKGDGVGLRITLGRPNAQAPMGHKHKTEIED